MTVESNQHKRLATGWRILLVGVALLGGGITALMVGSENVRTRVLDTLALIGGSYRVEQQVAASSAQSDTRSEYLVVLSASAEANHYHAYFEQHPDIDYLSESIYPGTIRVSLPVPVGAVLEELKAQSFASFVIRNLPIFFCH